MDCTPQGLVTTAQPLQAIPDGYQLSQLTSLFAQWAGVSVDAGALAKAASSLQSLDGIGPDVLIALLAKISGGSVDSNVISKAASCGFCGIPTGYQMIVLNSIMCQIVEGGGGGGTITVVLPTDPDAATWFCLAITTCFTNSGCSISWACSPGASVPLNATCAVACGINQATINAIDQLVISLKSAGLWSLLDIIYPFVGGNPSTCSLNLKDGTKFPITWHGGMTFSSNGISSDGSTGYGDTGWIPNTNGVQFTLNSGSLGVYQKVLNGGVSYRFSCGSASGLGFSQDNLGYNSSIQTLLSRMGNSLATVVTANVNGNLIGSRTASNLTTVYAPDGTTGTDASAPNGLSPASMYVPGYNQGGLLNTAVLGTISFMFAGAGLSAAQVATLSGIITTFETALGRA